jgi:hypothetical protein
MNKIKNFNQFLNENYSQSIKESNNPIDPSAGQKQINPEVIKKWSSSKMESIQDVQKFLKDYGIKVANGKGGYKELNASGKLDNDTATAFWDFWYGNKSMTNPSSKFPQPKTIDELAKIGGYSPKIADWFMRKKIYNFINAKNGVKPVPPFQVKPDSLGTKDYYQIRNSDFKMRNKDKNPPDYYLEYGDKYVKKFKDETRAKLSDKGKSWLDRTLLNLQNAIEKKLKVDPKVELDANKFRTYCFDSHPPSYINAGLFRLGPEDLYQIALTPEWRDLLSPESMLQVLEIIKQWSKEKANEVLKLPFRVWNSAKSTFESKVRTVEKELESWYKSLKKTGEKISDTVSDFMNWISESKDERDMENYNLI